MKQKQPNNDAIRKALAWVYSNSDPAPFRSLSSGSHARGAVPTKRAPSKTKDVSSKKSMARMSNNSTTNNTPDPPRPSRATSKRRNVAAAAASIRRPNLNIKPLVRDFCTDAFVNDDQKNHIRSLTIGWNQLSPGVDAWLESLGRDANEINTSGNGGYAHRITFSRPPIETVKDDRVYGSAKYWTIKGAELRALFEESDIFYGETREISAAPIVPVPDKTVKRMRQDDPEEDQRGQLTNIFGSAYVLANNAAEFATKKLDPEHAQKVYIASISGINLAYSISDQRNYIHPDTLDIKGTKIWDQIVRIWRMALIPMSAKNVRVAVLNAIGCGAFLRGVFQGEKVRSLYARALRMLLEDPVKYLSFDNRMTLQAVVVCFPAVDKMNFQAYQKAFEDGPKDIDVYLRPDLLSLSERFFVGKGVRSLPSHDMVSISAAIAERIGGSVAMLNPSDVEATRLGRIGVYFDGGDIALEEYIAVATTVLTTNRYLNPDLWNDRGRHHAITLDTKGTKIAFPGNTTTTE